MNMNRLVLQKIAQLEEAKTTELSEVQVDLALVDELKGLTKTGFQIAKDLEDPLIMAAKIKNEIAAKQKELETTISTIKKAYTAASKYQSQEDKLYAKLEKTSAELGLKPKDIEGWADYMAISSRVNNAINGGNQYMM